MSKLIRYKGNIRSHSFDSTSLVRRVTKMIEEMNSRVSTSSTLEYVTNLISLNREEELIIPKLVGGLINEITDRMSRECMFFALVYTTVYLVGSYRDRIKISKPDEYDFNVLLNFPKAKVVNGPEEIGTVKIDMSAYMDSEDQYSYIRQCLDHENFLIVSCVKVYFESLLKQIQITKKPIEIRNHTLFLKLKKAGPAHEFQVRTDEHGPINTLRGYRFSFDFVPSVVFNIGQKDELIAIPKPFKGGRNVQLIHFIPSHPSQENFLMKDKQHMKMVLRLVKKIRDRFKINDLKSYFIKTIFLWVHKEKGTKYWSRAPSILIEEMLQKILKYLEERNIPFFWRPKFNMLSNLSAKKIGFMRFRMAMVIERYRKFRNNARLIEIFLDRKELIEVLTNGRRKRQRRFRGSPEDLIFDKKTNRTYFVNTTNSFDDSWVEKPPGRGRKNNHDKYFEYKDEL